jgi:bifunctional NMN adenylyltransferase/nudix hydrolase
VTNVKKYDLAIFIGRMAPLHNAHLDNIRLADSIADRVVVILGSANAPRDERNPFGNRDRSFMVEAATMMEGISGVGISFINDMPSNDLWAAEVMRLSTRYISGIKAPKIAIVGHKKDDSSFYLDLFPTWDFIESGAKMHGDEEMAATKIREYMFEGNFDDAGPMMPYAVWSYVNEKFIGTEMFRELLAEYNFHKAYPAHRRAKYPINDVTADAVVLCKSHILLIRRKNIPGKGKLALPGGFVNTNETVEDGAIRELDEETKLHVPEKVLRKSIIDEKRFDNPKRSLRGRLMTFAFTFKIDTNHDGSLPRVYGSDDADKAFWVPISEIAAPEHAADFFEDHHNIIMTMIGRAAQQNN